MARKLWMALVFPFLAGCRGSAPPVMPTWASPEEPYVPSEGSSNAFDGYMRAATQAEADAPKQLVRVAFTPGQKRAAIQQSQRALGMLRSAASRTCDFQFRARKPFVPPAHHAGWRLLGRVIAWSVQDAAAAGDYDRAVSDTILAHKFGFDLTGGSAVDASLGLVIANDARRAIAPYLPKMGAGQLGTLSTSLARLLETKPTVDKMMEHEARNMGLAIQTLQDAYRADDWAAIEKGMGADGRDAIKYLRELKSDDTEKRPPYFEGLKKDLDTEVAQVRQWASQPASKREERPEPAGERPWRRFSRHFFRTGEPVLEMTDATLARTRLLALHARLLQASKAMKRLPTELSGYPALLRTDPYSGDDLIYEKQGLDFDVYSVGSNFQDDGGETDTSFTAPDLKLERP